MSTLPPILLAAIVILGLSNYLAVRALARATVRSDRLKTRCEELQEEMLELRNRAWDCERKYKNLQAEYEELAFDENDERYIRKSLGLPEEE